MNLYNDTTLRQFLVAVRRKVLELSQRQYMLHNHPDYLPQVAKAAAAAEQICEQWEIIRVDLGKLLGISLIPANELVRYGSILSSPCDGDPLSMALLHLKKLADKARRSDPSITLLKSWDVAKKHRPIVKETNT